MIFTDRKIDVYSSWTPNDRGRYNDAELIRYMVEGTISVDLGDILEYSRFIMSDFSGINYFFYVPSQHY